METVTPLYIASLSSSSAHGNAYVVWDDSSRPILIDCGISLRRLTTCLRELGMEPEDLSGLFITHEHSDHIRAMCLRKPVCQRFEVPVFASAKFWTWYDRCVPRDIDPEHRKMFGPGDAIEVSGIRVEAFSKPHDAVEPLGFVVESQGERAGFAMDLGHVPPHVGSALKGLDHLVFESNYDFAMEERSGRPEFLIRRVMGGLGHLSNDQAAEALADLVTPGTKQVILTHLSTECNRPGIACSVVSDALRQKGYSPTVCAAPAGEMAVYG